MESLIKEFRKLCAEFVSPDLDGKQSKYEALAEKIKEHLLTNDEKVKILEKYNIEFTLRNSSKPPRFKAPGPIKREYSEEDENNQELLDNNEASKRGADVAQ